MQVPVSLKDSELQVKESIGQNAPEGQVRIITAKSEMTFPVVLGVSARHAHLSREHMDILFGKGSELHVKKPIGQPGQYASEEQIRLVTEKGEMKLRIIGPLRPETQIELAITDARKMGLKAPIRNSGDIAGSAGGRLIGPAGELELKEGIIIAAPHVHLYPKTAAKYGLSDGDIVDIVTNGSRALTMHNVLVRTGEKHADEVHIDTDEANACNLESGVMVNVVFNRDIVLWSATDGKFTQVTSGVAYSNNAK